VHAFLFDASALVKRYAPEVGAAVVDYLFAQAGRGRLLCLMLGVAEVSAALVRKRNSGSITSPMFAAAMTQLRMEVLMAADFIKLPADNALIATAIPLAEKHAINATDAIVLQTALTIITQRRAAGDDLVLVASDQRLLRAAQAEGVFTLNPETQTETDCDAFLQA
jgi:predicted nucleic acid-binding protein